jgi:hypothetical protein
VRGRCHRPCGALTLPPPPPHPPHPRFAEASVQMTGQAGYDRVRQTVIGKLKVRS